MVVALSLSRSLFISPLHTYTHTQSTNATATAITNPPTATATESKRARERGREREREGGQGAGVSHDQPAGAATRAALELTINMKRPIRSSRWATCKGTNAAWRKIHGVPNTAVHPTRSHLLTYPTYLVLQATSTSRSTNVKWRPIKKTTHTPIATTRTHARRILEKISATFHLR